MVFSSADFQAMRLKNLKKKFEKAHARRTRKSTLSFEEYLKLFGSDSESMRAIARKAGITPQTLSDKYSKYFEAIVPSRKTRRDRQSSRTDDVWEVLAKKPSEDPVLNLLTKAALSSGRRVRQAIYWFGQNRAFKKRELFVNNRICRVSDLGGARTDGACRQYTPTTLHRSYLEGCDFLVVYHHPKGYDSHIFVIPAKVLLAHYEELDGTCEFRFPKIKKPAVGRIPRIDFWQYENAWHLIVRA